MNDDIKKIATPQQLDELDLLEAEMAQYNDSFVDMMAYLDVIDKQIHELEGSATQAPELHCGSAAWRGPPEARRPSRMRSGPSS